jgi:hypothetical protein
MKNKREVAEIILKGILISGGIAVAATSPYFVPMVLPKIIKTAKYELKKRKKLKNFYRSFYYLRSQGFIGVEDRNGQIYISLTPEGRKKAGKYNVDNMQIKQPKKWDKKWRILIFDIREKQKIKREALRGKIKELGLYKLQESVWVYPYDFQKEMEMLRTFFYLKHDEMKIIMASEIEDDKQIRLFFDLY